MSSAQFLRIPSELVLEILAYLSPLDLVNISTTCRGLRRSSMEDNLWRSLIQDNVPGLKITSPAPRASFRDLYLSLSPLWTLPRGKLWFYIGRNRGRLMIIRYSQARQRIEGDFLLVQRENFTMQPWSLDSNVIVYKWDAKFVFDPANNGFTMTADELDDLACSRRIITGARKLRFRFIKRKRCQDLFILMHEQIIGNTGHSFVGSSSQLLAQARTYKISPHFGLKPPWQGGPTEPSLVLSKWIYGNPSDNTASDDRRIAVTTIDKYYETLPAKVYTPTAKKPWRGIFSGDYGGHGCEFIAIMQPDDPGPLPDEAWLELMRLGSQQSQPDAWYTMLKQQAPLSSSSSSISTSPPCDQSRSTEINVLSEESQCGDAAGQTIATTASQKCSAQENVETERNNRNTGTDSRVSSTKSSPIHQGCIKAVKITGDFNVPHGEITFVAPDIGDVGLIRIADDDEFRGARVVRSVGHIAEERFRDDQYIASQLILVSPDQIAVHWEDLNHISFFHRIDIDALIQTD